MHVVFVVDPAHLGPGRRRAHRVAGRDAARDRRGVRRAALDPRTATRAPWSRGWPATSVRPPCTCPRSRSPTAGAATPPSREALARDDVAWVETGKPLRGHPGSGPQGRRLAVPGVHAVLPRLARARLAGSGRRAARASASPRRDDDKRVAAMLDKALRDGPDDLPEAGERAALRRWEAFRDTALDDYATARDLPAKAGTSGLSPYLKVGAVHPRTLLADLAGRRSKDATTFTDELGWREFYADVLWHRPESAWHDLREELAGMRLRRPRRRVRRVARGPHRLPDRRRRDAPAARDRLDAQPGADGHRQLPREGPARLVAARRPALPRPPARRRRRVEQPRLAVGGRHRHRRGAVLPRLQPGHPGQEVRPDRRLRAPLGAGAGAPRGQGRPRAVGARRAATTTATRGGSSTTPRSGAWRWTATGRPGGEGARVGSARGVAGWLGLRGWGFTTVCSRTRAPHDGHIVGSAGSSWGAHGRVRFAAVIPAYRGEPAVPTTNPQPQSAGPANATSASSPSRYVVHSSYGAAPRLR